MGDWKTRSRQYFAALHFSSAVEFALRAYAIEEAADHSSEMQQQAFVTGSVMMSVAFLEAAINEFFSDMADSEPVPILFTGRVSVDSEARLRLRRVWGLGADKHSVQRKFDLALAVLSRPPIDWSRKPAQDVANLIDLRNSLVHFKPRWRNGKERIHRWEQALENSFPPNGLSAGKNMHFFPGLCLGYGCAEWAIRSARAFMDEFAAAIEFRGSPWYVTGLDPLNRLPPTVVQCPRNV